MGNKIVILGYSGSVHVTRWVQGLTGRGLTITVVSLGGRKIDGVETIILDADSGRQWGYIKYLPRIKRIIKELNPALVHSHYAAGFGLWGAYSGCHPFVISVWGTDIIDFPNRFHKKYLLKKVLSSADYLTATSQFLGEKTIQLQPSIRDKLAIIPFGVKIPEFKSAYLDKKQIKLIYIKVHAPRYGPDILVKAIYALIQQGMDISLTMAGSGEMTEDLKKMTEKLNMAARVSFVGFVDNRQIPSLLAEHDIMVMPSLEESFGVAALEAASVGLPVIASDIGGVPEVVKDSETGILVKPGDIENLTAAIKKLAGDAELRKRMGTAGREFVRTNYDWEKNLDQMIDLYDRLINGKGRT
jgi:glycosyltransferase involved in cell wall biosynthesis